MICPNCKSEMRLKEKDGSKFWGCPSWSTKGCKTVKYSEDVQGFSKPTLPEKADGFKILADEIIAMRRDLSNFLKKMEEETGM